MNNEKSLKKDKASLCRIKVNKMISSLNSHKDIFIPKYTLTNRNEAKYLSDINKSRKGYSISKASNNKNDIRITENLTVNFQEETIYAFTEGQGTITFPLATTGKILLVAGGGAGGGYDASETAVDVPENQVII